MMLFIMPALLALALKVYILIVASSKKSSKLFCCMVIVLAAHNLTEVLLYGFYYVNSGKVSEHLLRVYYVATMAMLFCMCLYSMEVSGQKALDWMKKPILAVLLAMSAGLLMTDLLVSGAKQIGYTATALQGDYYWVFTTLTLFSLIFAPLVLMRGYLNADQHRIQVQCLYNLIALLPTFILGLIIVPAVMMGLKVNAAGLLPLCTTLFLLITLKSESKHQFTDIRRFLPFSKERKTASEVQILISKFSMDEISYKEMSNEFEKIAIKHKLDQADDSISQAARLLQVKRSTLYSMLDRHGIQRESK